MGVYKKQIERDQTSYQNRCKGMSVAQKNRWPKPSEQIEKSDCKLSLVPSAAITNSNNNPDNNINNENKNRVSALIGDVANNFNANAEPKYEIYHDFSFSKLMERDRGLANLLSIYPDKVLLKTQDALVRKCLGKKMAMSAIIKWLDEQYKHYKENGL